MSHNIQCVNGRVLIEFLKNKNIKIEKWSKYSLELSSFLNLNIKNSYKME